MSNEVFETAEEGTDPSPLETMRAWGGFVYLATPYSKYPQGIEAAWKEACVIAAHLIRNGIPVYSPIAHTHPVAQYGGIDPLDHAVWLPADAPMMRAASGLVVAKLPSWEESYGVAEEIKAFRTAGKPVVYLPWIPQCPDIPSQECDAEQETILQEAQRITSGDRQRDYDHPLPNHERIAALWNTYLAIRKHPMEEIVAADVASMMILLKLARNAFTPKRDSWVDVAGYARCGARIEGFEP